MNTLLARTLDTVPKISEHINGTIKQTYEELPEFLSTIFASSIDMLDKRVNIKYRGYRYMSPEEEYKAGISKNATNKTNIDLSKSSLYMVVYEFEFEGNIISRPLLLPYADRGNLLSMSGTTYVVSLVLSDKVISADAVKVFVRLLISKINFMSKSKNQVVDGVRIAQNIIYSTDISKVTANEDKIGNPLPPIGLYILSKYGLHESFNKYGNVKRDDIRLAITVTDAEREEFVVYESDKNKPRGYKQGVYIPHNLKVLIRRDIHRTQFIENMITSIIYALDMLPALADDAVDVIGTNRELDYWMLILGKLVYKGAFSVSRIMVDMRSHINILNGYLDQIAKDMLGRTGYKINDFFDFLAYTLEKHSELLTNSKTYNNDLDNKYLDVNYYTTFDIFYSYHKILLHFNKRVSNNSNPLTFKEVEKMFKSLTTKMIYGLIKSNNANLTLSVADWKNTLTNNINLIVVVTVMCGRYIQKCILKYI